MEPDMNMLVLNDLACHFRVGGAFDGVNGTVKALNRVSLAIPRGTTFGLVGESGCGKSTLAKVVAGLLKPTSGQVLIDGQVMGSSNTRSWPLHLRRRVQMVFQDPYSSLNPRWTVRSIIAEPIRVHRLLPTGRDVARRVDELLELVGLSSRDAGKYPHQFSGGQRQRIAIARALASEPSLLICDEPTSALDVSVQAQLLNLLRELQRRAGLTYLFISHNLGTVYHMADQVGVMYLGRLVETAATDTLFRKPVHPYTRMLLDTVPSAKRIGARQDLPRGEPPDPINPPPGCGYNLRCPYADDLCRTEPPPHSTVETTRVACHAASTGRLAFEKMDW